MVMNIKLSHCFLAVDDHDKALTFYRDVFGFEVRNDVGSDRMRWITVVRRPSPNSTSSSNRRARKPRRPIRRRLAS